MVRLDLHPRFLRRVRKLSARQAAAVESALQELQTGFGEPHRHSGLGVRRLRRSLYECRAGQDLRVLFWAEAGLLTVFDAMAHDEIKNFLRNF
jgi:mRNA-degrading endonuclease RelE of RelBE toxin-antitoxin system